MKKIALFELEQWEKEYFQQQFPDCELHFFDHPLEERDLSTISSIEVLVIFIYSRITQEVIEKLPNLVLITTMSTGTDHIDMTAAHARNITVVNVPTYGENTVAEHTFALLLALSRKIIESYKRVQEWSFLPNGLTGFDLAHKTIGIVGVGNIGRHVAKIAKGFEMNILAYKRTPDLELEKEFGLKIVDLLTLYKDSDIITLHVPYSPETQHMINDTAFSQMKDGVILINTARGGLVDTNALIKALDSGKVKAAGLDVLEEEPLLREEKELLAKGFDQKQLVCILENHMLVSHKNVLITPHNAFNSYEALQKIVKTTEENIKAFFLGTPQNVIK